MNGVVVVGPAEAGIELLRQMLEEHGSVERTTHNGLMLTDSEGHRLYIHPLPIPEVVGMVAFAERFTSEPASLAAHILEFSDIEIAKRVLQAFASRWEVVIDDDHNALVTGREFLAKLDRNPAWDWRNDEIVPRPLMRQLSSLEEMEEYLASHRAFGGWALTEATLSGDMSSIDLSFGVEARDAAGRLIEESQVESLRFAAVSSISIDRPLNDVVRINQPTAVSNVSVEQVSDPPSSATQHKLEVSFGGDHRLEILFESIVVLTEPPSRS